MSIRQIARLARVSTATVSLALKDSPKIPVVTRKRVLKAAKSVGYSPNAKIAEMMAHVRAAREGDSRACFGVVSFYDTLAPWRDSLHLRRMYEGMNQRAKAIGYRLEPLWMKAPGMTWSRFRTILDTRGIEGLLCFGSPTLDQQIPPELNHYAIVTQGLSIKTPLHRVITDAYNDTWRALDEVYARGYRRPGLILGDYEDARSGHANLSAYLGWSELVLRKRHAIPILRLNRVEEKPLVAWLKRHQPDVMIVSHIYNVLSDLNAIFRRNRIRIPGDVGVVAVTQVLQGTAFSGMEEDQTRIGAWAVELLAARIVNRDIGIPKHPHIEMVGSRWVDGSSLRSHPG